MATQKLTLKYVKDSKTGKARLYEDKHGARQWVPVSVCPTTVKHPPLTEQHLPLHDVDIQEWWLGKNPWPKTTQKDFGF